MEHINTKVNMAIIYINYHNLQNKMLQISNSNCRYTLKIYLFAHYFKEYFRLSYEKLEEMKEIFEENIKIPSKTALNIFKLKMAKYEISKKMHKEYITKENLITEILLIDSSFIPNKCCNKKSNLIGINSFYKNKFGCKVTFITNEKGFPLYESFESGNKNDAKIADTLINSMNNNELNGKLLLADSGYDSKKLKINLDHKICKYIIPINKRNKDSIEVKNEKDNLKKCENEKILHLKEQIKSIKKDKNNKQKIEEIKKELLKNKEELKLKMKNVKNKIKKDLIKYNKINNIKDKKKKIFNTGLSNEDKKIYKIRTRIEHTFSILKNSNSSIIMDKKEITFMETIYSRIIDMIIFRENKKT
jgi:hypothetical protein